MLKKKHKPGITRELFKNEPEEFSLPEHLQGAMMGGQERARSLARLYKLEGTLYNRRIFKFVTSSMINILDDPSNSPPADIKSKRVNWVMIHMRNNVINQKLSKPLDQAITQVLLLVDIAPDSLSNSLCWKDVLKALDNLE